MNNEKQNVFIRLWRGEETLASAYFEFYVFLPALISIFLRMLGFVFYGMGPVTGTGKFIALTYIYLYFFVYFPFSSIAVWRCGKNSKTVFWRYISRALIIIGMLGWLYSIYLLLFDYELFMQTYLKVRVI